MFKARWICVSILLMVIASLSSVAQTTPEPAKDAAAATVEPQAVIGMKAFTCKYSELYSVPQNWSLEKFTRTTSFYPMQQVTVLEVRPLASDDEFDRLALVVDFGGGAKAVALGRLRKSFPPSRDKEALLSRLIGGNLLLKPNFSSQEMMATRYGQAEKGMSSMAVLCALGMPETKIEDSMGFEWIYDKGRLRVVFMKNVVYDVFRMSGNDE
jgi:hypothetical protein